MGLTSFSLRQNIQNAFINIQVTRLTTRNMYTHKQCSVPFPRALHKWLQLQVAAEEASSVAGAARWGWMWVQSPVHLEGSASTHLLPSSMLCFLVSSPLC